MCKHLVNGVCVKTHTPCTLGQTSLNTDVITGVKWRSPNEWNKFKNPWDNLIYAIMLRAVFDVRGYNDSYTKKYHCGADAIEWLESTGREYKAYLNDRERITRYEENAQTDSYTKKHKQNKREHFVNR